MEINWLGKTCFRIKGKQTTIVTDPFLPEAAGSLSRTNADILCLSYQKPEEAGEVKIGGEPYIIQGPGEYEVGGVLVIGIPSFQDESKGSIRGKNTIYALEIEELAICYLGKLGHMLTDEQIEVIGNVDILLLPVGGNVTINATQAARLVRNIEPNIVIPMYYKTPAANEELDPVDKFLNEIGSQGLTAQAKLNISKNSLPQGTQIVLLESPA
ncbi:MAG: MBL fold metallo-hydrolase [Dehalococcoidaceae bacterium]|nr:MBL fold metallo-hydrolase [Dehalococcoidaceae bacterium]